MLNKNINNKNKYKLSSINKSWLTDKTIFINIKILKYILYIRQGNVLDLSDIEILIL